LPSRIRKTQNPGVGPELFALRRHIHLRARELLLPLLTLPLWIPFIIAGGQAVQSAFGLPGSYQEAIGLLIDFDILFVVLTSLAARFVLDD